MGWKSSVVTGATILGLLVGANELLMPKTPQQLDQYRREQLVEQASDAVEKENERRRDELPGEIDAEKDRILRPGEYGPAEPKRPRLRLRP
jgi:hypothetical protein